MDDAKIDPYAKPGINAEPWPTEPCRKCGQVDQGQTGEYPCEVCGLPTVWDDEPRVEGGDK